MRFFKKNLGRKKILGLIIGIVVGGIAGYLYYKFVGCASGACPITKNPYASSIYGAVLGALIGSSV